jgi:toxin-antitoxin system PIN domain toxin
VLLLDVNPLVYALRADVPEHPPWLTWLESALAGAEPIGVSNSTLTAVVRIATSSRIFSLPTPLDATLAFVDSVRNAPAYLPVEPGAQHWNVFDRLCRKTNIRGNLASDAWLAALSIELGAVLVTADSDFGRFAGLKFSNPTQAHSRPVR